MSNREYKQQLRGRWQELADKHSWWKDEVQQKSTLNAVLARSYESESKCDRHGLSALGRQGQADLVAGLALAALMALL